MTEAPRIDVQVVASPFLWSRMRKPGQEVPFMFQEFVDEQAAQPEAQQLSQPPPATLSAPAQASMTAAQVAAAIAEAVHSILGPQACPVASACSIKLSNMMPSLFSTSSGVLPDHQLLISASANQRTCFS